jgi:hypothetical protein
MHMPRALTKAMLVLCAALAGCSGHRYIETYSIVDYGGPPPKHDPTVEITDFTYTPASPIHINDKQTFTATLNNSMRRDEPSIVVEIGSELQPVEGYAGPVISLRLSDGGRSREEETGDGIYSWGYWWLSPRSPQQDIPVTVHLEWADGYHSDPVYAEPLTVLPAEEDE